MQSGSQLRTRPSGRWGGSSAVVPQVGLDGIGKSLTSTNAGPKIVSADAVRWTLVLLQGLLNQMIFTYYISSTSTTSVSEALETSWQKRLIFVVFFLWATGFALIYFYFFKRKFKRDGVVLGCVPVRYFQVQRLISGATWVVTGIGIAAVGPNTEAKTHNLLTAILYVSYSVTELCNLAIRNYDSDNFEPKFQPTFASGVSPRTWVMIRRVILLVEFLVLVMAWIAIGLFFGAPCDTTCRNQWEYVSVGMQAAFVLFFVLE